MFSFVHAQTSESFNHLNVFFSQHKLTRFLLDQYFALDCIRLDRESTESNIDQMARTVMSVESAGSRIVGVKY